MIKKRGLFFLLFLFLFLCGLLGLHILNSITLKQPDMAAVNRIVKIAEGGFSSGTFEPAIHIPYEYSVLDQKGALLYRTSDAAPVSSNEAVNGYGLVFTIENKGQILGSLLIETGLLSTFNQTKKELCILLMIASSLLFLFLIVYSIFLNRKIILPFRKLEDFSSHVAAGNLDFPLPMDQGHAFGAFTESFDLMREQLKRAKQKEAAANRSKKELVAALSHDIKTPVASIKLLSELLLVTEAKPAMKKKLETIYEKSEQIDRLITNMLQSSLEDLGELKVHPTEESSAALEEIIRRADYGEKADIVPFPGCILMMDLFRIEEIIGNIFGNAYKYAGTAISVISDLTEEGLRIEFKDYGKGVPDEELPYIFQKFYRGSNCVLSADGSGLGLYISRYLIEKMGGMIDCFNREDGFSIVLFIPLSHPVIPEKIIEN